MLYILAIIFPPACHFVAGKPGEGILSIILWITMCGWPFATAWAMFTVAQHLADERTKRLEDAIERSNSGRRRR